MTHQPQQPPPQRLGTWKLSNKKATSHETHDITTTTLTLGTCHTHAHAHTCHMHFRRPRGPTRTFPAEDVCPLTSVETCRLPPRTLLRLSPANERRCVPLPISALRASPRVRPQSSRGRIVTSCPSALLDPLILSVRSQDRRRQAAQFSPLRPQFPANSTLGGAWSTTAVSRASAPRASHTLAQSARWRSARKMAEAASPQRWSRAVASLLAG